MASLALNSGIPIDAIQALGNWKTRRVVEGYAHLSNETIIDAAALMAKVTGRQLPDEARNNVGTI
jgi:transcriptional regulator of met regulon